MLSMDPGGLVTFVDCKEKEKICLVMSIYIHQGFQAARNTLVTLDMSSVSLKCPALKSDHAGQFVQHN